MTFDAGSLILIDYTATIKDTDKLFGTTIEQDAKKHNTFAHDVVYRPKLVSLGDYSYPVMPGLDEALKNTSVGDKLTIEVTPEKGFGNRDPNKVRIIPLRKLGDDADKVSVGDEIEIDGKKGTIRFISSGRVQIDYNHKFAGKTILFDVHVVKSLDSQSDKIQGIIQNKFYESEYKLELGDKHVTVTLNEDLLHNVDLQNAKQLICKDIFKFIPTLEKLTFLETFINKSAKNDPDDSPDTSQNDTQKSD